MPDNNYDNLITIKLARAEQPKFEERKGKGYIEFGADNKYPDYLLGLYNESPKHGAIIKGKVNYIFGKGFKDAPAANTQGESWNTIVKKCILDDEIFGGYYLQIVWNKARKVKEVYHIRYINIRTNKDESRFWVKNDWQDGKEKPREYTAFTGTFQEGEYTQILFVKQYNPRGEVYPLPNYFQGLNYVDADVQVSRHILGNAKDGFVAGTMIQLNNGEPPTEQKGEIERRLKKKFTGSEGDRVLIMFNSSRENGAEVSTLGQTMLTKEDFTNINNLIQQEIFAAHQITSPALFGIKTEGQLGGRNEIRDAYEIFNNTYVNERQQAFNELFGKLIQSTGVQGEFKIVPVEPLGFALQDDMLLKVMPREYFLDKLGVDQKYYILPTVDGTAPASPDPSGTPAAPVNSNLASMTGRQFQQLERIKRKYERGNLTREQAAMMLRSSFGLTDEDIALFLDANSDDHQFATQEELDFALLEQFAQVGEDAGAYQIISKRPAGEVEYFAETKQLTELESNIINLINKDKRITAEVIAETLKRDVATVKEVMARLTKANVLTERITKVGEDEIVERQADKTKVSGYKPTVTSIQLRYLYDGPKDSKNRPFCAKLMSMNKLYSRSDIEKISERLGYSVWDRRGGWFTQPDGTHRPSCRHQWFAVTVIKQDK
jgi:DNA-binding Lrp family transcriptional regulator